MKRAVYGIIIAGLCVGAVVVYARWMERSSVYYPNRVVGYTPESIDLPFEDVYFYSADGVKLNGWFVPAVDPRGTLIYLHGNAGNIGDRLDKIRIFNELGLDVLIFDYRGYGRSDGSPSEEGTYRDAVAAYDYLISRGDVEPSGVILYGKSLGGAIAADLAGKRKVRALITNSAFTSIVDMARKVYPFLPVKYFVTIKYDTASKIADLDVPKLVIHSRDDEIVPFGQGRELYEKASGPKEFYEMRGGHNDAAFVYEEEFKRKVHLFLESLGI